MLRVLQKERDSKAARRALTCDRLNCDRLNCSRSGADGVQLVVIPAHVNDAVGNGRRGFHAAAGCVTPHFRPGGSVEGVDVVIIAPHVDGAVNDSRGGPNFAFGPVVSR